MTTDGGGWTLVVGINGANKDHQNTSSVTPENLSSISGYGKYSDSIINLLASNQYKLICAGNISTYTSTCLFNSTISANGDCLNLNYEVNHLGLSEWNSSNTLTKGVYANPGTNGCFDSSGWGDSGKLWVK